MLRLRILFPLLMAVAAVAAGCGGGGGATPFTTPAATATPTPNPGPTNIPVGPTSSPQTVFLASGNYTLAFTVPPVTNGTTATMSAVLQTTLPTNVNAPQSRTHFTPVKPLASIYNGLVYLVVSTSATVGFSSTPTFNYTVPAAAIPSGQHAYLLYWDPAVGQINGWINLGVGSVSGNTVTFPGVSPYGITLDKAQSPYIFALAVSAQTVPTSTPAPTPTPTPNAQQTPAYCQTEGIAQSSGDTINLTDSSGLSNSMLVVYVQQQAPLGGSTAWMNATGTFTSVPVPLAAGCYSSTQGSSVASNPLVIPTGHAGRIYLVYASAVPPTTASVPNPFSNVPAGSQPINGVAGAPYIYDKIEYNSTSGVIDTTQVDFLGLPIEMSAVASTSATPLPQAVPSSCPASVPTAAPFSGVPALGTIVGVGQCGYGAIYQTLTQDANYGNLVSRLPWTPTSSQVVDFRVVSPGGSRSYTPFDYNLLGDASVTLPAACQSIVGAATGTYGYLSCALKEYQTTSEVFQAQNSLGGNGSNDYYCISADASDFIATDIGTAKTCGSPAKSVTPPAVNPFKIPIALFTNAYYTSSGSSGSCFYGELFNGPYGNANVGSGQVFATADAFTLWKALELEINYGTMFQAGPHPVEVTPPSLQTTPGMFKDPAWNLYAKVVHEYFDGNFAYAISYDDGFSWYSGYSLTAPGTINIRINPIPASGSPTSANPSQFPDPACSTLTLGVGSY